MEEEKDLQQTNEVAANVSDNEPKPVKESQPFQINIITVIAAIAFVVIIIVIYNIISNVINSSSPVIPQLPPGCTYVTPLILGCHTLSLLNSTL
jgi:uncharacterized membrane protein YvbJ